MDGLASDDAFQFEGFRLDRNGLWRLGANGRIEPVPLGSRAFDLLRLLVERHGEVVSKDEIIAAVWGGMAVEEGNLTVQISALRRVVDQGRKTSWIQTSIGRGYRFAALVTPKKEHAVATEITQAPRLSIVVLPFVNLSNDPDQDYFADAITDDLTTDLTRIEGLFVIASNTAFTYKHKPVDAKRVGRDLGVRFVLEGSVRRFGSQLRVNAQLVDANTGGHLWAERFERHATDLVNVEDEVIGRIAGALQLELFIAEADRASEQPDAMEYTLRGRAAIAKAQNRKGWTAAIDFYERALAIDPHYARAQGELAIVLVARVLDLMTDTPAADLERAADLVERAVAAAPRSMMAHQGWAQVLRAQRRWEEAMFEYQKVIEINRNFPYAYSQLALCKLVVRGALDEAASLAHQAIRLSPRDPGVHGWYARLGQVEILRSRTAQAAAWYGKARHANPGHPGGHAGLAAAYGLAGEYARAAAALASARRLSHVYSSLARVRMYASGADPESKVRICSKPPTSPGCAPPACRRSN